MVVSLHRFVILILLSFFWSSNLSASEKTLPERCDEMLLGNAKGIELAARKIVKKVSGVSRLMELYKVVHAKNPDADQFWQMSLDILNIQMEVKGDLSKIPAEGTPLVIVSNHPYGMLDGIALSNLISKYRSDYMVLGNSLLWEIPEIRPRIFSLDILSKSAARANMAVIAKATAHVQAGGALIIFPSGTVGTAPKVFDKTASAVDSEWLPTVGKIISKTKAVTLPVHFDGRNSALFHMASKLPEKIRGAARVGLLPREFINKENTTLKLQVGSPIVESKMKLLADADGANTSQFYTKYLRSKVENIEKPRALEPIAAPLEKERRHQLMKEALASGHVQELRADGSFKVYRIKGENLHPELLLHLGVLREQTFRLAGEGSGKSSDIDEFDLHYEHLLIWNEDSSDIIGAYRVKSFDEAIATGRYESMYSNFFFPYRTSFFAKFYGGILEMGRSFIVPEYQNNPKALGSLWGAISEYLYQNPQYRYLCGPVSLSANNSEKSKTLVYNYFMKNHGDDLGLKNDLSVATPFRGLEGETPAYSRFAELEAAIKNIEGNDEGLPPLMKHYASLLDAKYIEAVMDPDFNTLDFLICVDMKNLSERKASYFLGDKEKGRVLSQRFKDAP